MQQTAPRIPMRRFRGDCRVTQGRIGPSHVPGRDDAEVGHEQRARTSELACELAEPRQ